MIIVLKMINLFSKVNNKKKGRQEIRRSNSKRIKFLHFTLLKTNTDTSEMLFLLGKQLSRKINRFNIAGKFYLSSLYQLDKFPLTKH